ncbi:hypothetical protein AB0O28_34695 [Microbispora sp. NPDC088329]|uniref:hypothetical protein n=1 Tax=Microbispora sp. NPDC088329 TaxID=3154869 RepID=UPI00341EB325
MPAYARALLPVPAGMRRHRAFTVVLTAAAALRVVTMLGYPPARLYWYDSFSYLHNAVHLRPEQGFHPIGYPLLLRALLPFHSVELIVVLQHAMGPATGVIVYAVLRGRGLPAWAAVAAAAPVLFDASFLRLEHAVLSDSLFILLVVAATALLVRRPVPSARAAATAGLLLAGATLTRTIALPLILLVLLALAVRRVPWRRIAAYATWYGGVHGRFGVGGLDGVALWARSMTFADCAVIQPPPDLAPLCPNGTVSDAAGEYVWAKDSSLNRLPGGHVALNDRARAFALRAIAAQPEDYLRDVVKDTALAFAWTPSPTPRAPSPRSASPTEPGRSPPINRSSSRPDGSTTRISPGCGPSGRTPTCSSPTSTLPTCAGRCWPSSCCWAPRARCGDLGRRRCRGWSRWHCWSHRWRCSTSTTATCSPSCPWRAWRPGWRSPGLLGARRRTRPVRCPAKRRSAERAGWHGQGDGVRGCGRPAASPRRRPAGPRRSPPRGTAG